ncbi:sulfotransferase family protein [Limimaricola hongkongensis]|uniref:Sulfotransferase n=1 Tax=Limimaricola hongkongensis DSM 17492 TaxID=1122180 RepID=A0A017H974_9RHOB|nr:sulfotransferase [Limimaricola hongkongensis]EYD70344.1 hypothetical protein Lokhon_00098 [Limimaricola hongkongensis DSM 17492]
MERRPSLGSQLARSVALGLHRARPGAGDSRARPLFVIGSGRSGNTLMRRLLMASGEIYLPPETYVLGEIIERWPRGALLSWYERVWLFCAYFEKHPEFPTFALDNLNAFADEAVALPPPARNLRSLFETFYRHLARQHGSAAHRWGDKTPYNTVHLPAIDALFPDAQYLWLLRDGRDVALSYVQAGLYDDLGAAAERWVSANRACAALARRGRDVYRQSYEDLVTAPERSVRAIYGWAGLDYAPGVLTDSGGAMGDVERRAHHGNVRRPISAASVGRWRAQLGPADLRQMPEAFAPLLAEYGYPG